MGSEDLRVRGAEYQGLNSAFKDGRTARLNVNGNSLDVTMFRACARLEAAAVRGVRILGESGNLLSGRWRLYGNN